jgi:cysteine-rich repeat protein
VTASAAASTVAGTPAYMAPEQFSGRVADVRTDQFSFCVALSMALHGRHPLDARAAGYPGATDGVPAALDAALARGLDRDPARRHASMDELLQALEAAVRVPPRPRAWSALAVAAVVVVVTGWLVAGARRGTDAPGALAGRCGDGRADPGEECDDGNRSDEDACLSSCRWARCGDGRVRAGVEECDDGNARDGDGCSAQCLACREGDARFVWPRNGHCYSRHVAPVAWPEARRRCEAAAGTLVSYTSSYEQRAVYEALFAGVTGPSWIGFTVAPSWGGPLPGAARAWLTGEPMNAPPPWADGEPRERCTVENPPGVLPFPWDERFMGDWRTEACDRPRPFVCERPGWTLRLKDDHAYRVFHDPLTWAGARAACEARGAHLVTVEDPDEQAILAAQGNAVFWIGATDQKEEGRYRWVTGGLVAVPGFSPGEPNGGTSQDCLVMAADGWRDRRCTDQQPYMCEHE